MALQFDEAPAPDFTVAPFGLPGGAEQFYLQTSPDPTFVTLHVPPAGRRSSVGVLLCPPFGWSELCTHRVRRTWANELADAGYPALRLDLPGTGDSAGSLASSRRLEAWISAVGVASTWLRDELECSRVCGLGIGLGGMLAWLAAAEGARLDDLILWGVPARGKQIVRELKVAAKVDIDSRVETAPEDLLVPAPPVPEDGGLLDEAGQLITKETLESLSTINLQDIPLPDPEQRRALILRRGGTKSDEILEQHLRALRVETTVLGDCDGYEPMMRYVQESVVPTEAIARSLNWLSSGSSGSGSRSDFHGIGSLGPDASADSIEIVQDGVLVRETPVSISVSSGDLAAIVTEPVGTAGMNLCVVFSSGGSDRRVGPNRLWVEAARSWAAQGITAVRFDPAGIGDSDGDERDWSALRAHYDPSQVDRLAELLDALQARGHPARFFLVGYCAGGYRSLHLALRDARVAGVGAIGLPFFHWTWWTVNIHDSWLQWIQPEPRDSKLKRAGIQVLRRLVSMGRTAHRMAMNAAQFFQNRGERLIVQLTARGTELVLVLKGSSYAHKQLVTPSRHARVRGIGRLRVNKSPGEDARFRPIVSQRLVRHALDDAVLRVAAERPCTELVK
jgi:pimeloyl-ACP methyl ester carboxylesterase